MRVNGTDCPVNQYSIELMPKKPNYRLVKFYQNPVQVQGGWDWDEYYLELLYYPGLEVDVENTQESLRQYAIELEKHNNKTENTHNLLEEVSDILGELSIDTDTRITELETAVQDLYIVVEELSNALYAKE